MFYPNLLYLNSFISNLTISVNMRHIIVHKITKLKNRIKLFTKVSYIGLYNNIVIYQTITNIQVVLI